MRKCEMDMIGVKSKQIINLNIHIVCFTGDITGVYFHIICKKHDAEINNTIAAVPFFFFPDAGLLVRSQSNGYYTFWACYPGFYNTSPIGVPGKQWLQQLYG